MAGCEELSTAGPTEGPASCPRPHSPLPSATPQASHKESEEALQKRRDGVSRELCLSQTSHASRRADAEKAQEQQLQMAGEGGVGPGLWGGQVSAGARTHQPAGERGPGTG